MASGPRVLLPVVGVCLSSHLGAMGLGSPPCVCRSRVLSLVACLVSLLLSFAVVFGRAVVTCGYRVLAFVVACGIPGISAVFFACGHVCLLLPVFESFALGSHGLFRC